MVVFTCNNCGDSVNKPKVEKHIQYECKRKHFAVSFCCVDCLKDFNFETVKSHCQCVTEEERYSAKGFVPKASSEKGKRKQAGWVDIVQSVINRKDLPNDERQFLNIIAKFDNVPRKKNKFQNFCFSTAPAYRKKGYLVDKVFDMIEAEYKAQQVQNSTEKPADSSKIQNKSDTDSLEINNTVQAETSEKPKKKKKSVANDKIENIHNENEETSRKEKKKRKQSVVEVKNDELESKSDDIKNADKKTQETPKKEKKKRKRSLDEVENEIKTKSEENIKPVSEKKKKKGKNNSVAEENLDINETNNIQTPSKNKKITDAGTNEENEIVNRNEELQINKKEKKTLKKKMKYQQELAIVSSGIVEVDKEPVSKSKKRKLIGNEENEEPQQKALKLDNEETQKISGVQSRRKFDWNEVITQVLQSKKSKKTSITKVMKRVMNEYHHLNETTKKSENELEKIFLKKLRKMKNVTIDNDKVQLVGC